MELVGGLSLQVNLNTLEKLTDSRTNVNMTTVPASILLQTINMRTPGSMNSLFSDLCRECWRGCSGLFRGDLGRFPEEK